MRPIKKAAVLLGAALLMLTVLQAPSTGAERGKKASYPQPKAGSWKFKDSFKENTGTLVVKAGLKGKSPAVKKIRIVALEPSGADCPAAGTTVKVKGSFTLRKGPKWADDYFKNKYAWISAKKDKAYDGSYPNELGMKVVPAKVKVGSQLRKADLAISFVKLKPSKPHEMRFAMRVYPADGSGGWCRFGGTGKPGK